MEKQQILSEIKRLVLLQEPEAEIILYGSHARGDYRSDSDMDILILLDKENIGWEYSNKIANTLYDIELDTGQMISPIIKSKKEWYNKYKITPFFKNVSSEGIVL